ncbi:hypothetical protein CJU90_3062 [Yarrowia sp. C11]|nr:hypothetical protein CKK34_4511 [Yarrowia sp. E02]KAG5369593.1 hypothetical protein CJU90_3062 [Yarrowia sp. C11]
MTAEQPELAIQDQPKELEITDGPATTASTETKPVEGEFNLKESEIVDPVDKVGNEDFNKDVGDDKPVDGKFDLKEDQIVEPVDKVGNEDFNKDEPAVDGKFDLKENEIVDPVDKVGSEDLDKKRPASEDAASAPKKKKLAGKKSKKYDSEPEDEDEDEDELPEEEEDLEDELDVLEDDEGEELSLDDIPPPSSRRNRKPVDYVAANKALEEEERKSREASGLPEDVDEEEDYVEVQEE